MENAAESKTTEKQEALSHRSKVLGLANEQMEGIVSGHAGETQGRSDNSNIRSRKGFCGEFAHLHLIALVCQVVWGTLSLEHVRHVFPLLSYL